MGTRRSFGRLRKLPSGRYQAAYIGPTGELFKAPATFAARIDAEGWLAQQRRAIDVGTWRHPDDPEPAQTLFRDYSELWLTQRDLRPRTRSHYRRILDRFLLPMFGPMPLEQITAPVIRGWHASTAVTTPTYRAHAYSLLRTILTTAHRDGLIDAAPPSIVGGGHRRRRHNIEPASLEELETITHECPPPYRLMILLSAWCALRFGEVTELRRKDVDLEAGVLRIRRGVVWDEDRFVVGPPKTAHGVRDVAVPPHLMPAVQDHLDRHSGASADALLFPARDGSGRHLSNSSLRKFYEPAREAAGRPDLRFHDLRHTGAVLAAQSGATLAELMNRLGHSSPSAAMIYQHTARGRDAQIAAQLSELADNHGK